jgi:hypothetical protein
MFYFGDFDFTQGRIERKAMPAGTKDIGLGG